MPCCIPRNFLKALSKNPPPSDSQADSTEADDTDDDGLGLKLLVEGVNPEVDIIAVHGLNGHRDKTWTADNGKMWLKDFLQADIPNARIFTYGYNASTHGDPSVQFLHQYAADFVDYLSLRLKDTCRRPIIFIAHSLGGILVKTALIHSDGAKVNFRERQKQIKLSTYGIIFMGTPHQGANVPLGSAILNIASVVIRTNRNLVMNLDRDSEYLQIQLESYLGIRDDFATVYCYETKPTPPLNCVVVPSASAIGGARDASNVGIAKDHIQMVKFSSSSTHDYQRVKEHVKNMVASAAGPVEANWKDWDRSKGREQETATEHPERAFAPAEQRRYEEHILAIQGGQSIYQRGYNDDTWTKHPGAAVWAAAGIDYSIWCCNAAQEIFRWNAATSRWDKMPGACIQINAWTHGRAVCVNASQSLYEFQNGNWRLLPGAGTHIAIGANGEKWYCNAAQEIFRWNAATSGWDRMPGACVQIDVWTHDRAVCVNASQNLYEFQNGDWRQLPGANTHITIGANGEKWVVNSNQAIYRMLPGQDQWQHISGSLKFIHCTDGNNVIGANAGGDLYRWNGSGWTKLPGSGTQNT